MPAQGDRASGEPNGAIAHLWSDGDVATLRGEPRPRPVRRRGRVTEAGIDELIALVTLVHRRRPLRG